jgi:hypothetical protein
MVLTSIGAFRELVGGSAAAREILPPPETFFTDPTLQWPKTGLNAVKLPRCSMQCWLYVAIIREFLPQDCHFLWSRFQISQSNAVRCQDSADLWLD